MKAAGIRLHLSLMALAVGFLTRLPVPSLRRFDAKLLARSALYFPLVGVLVGLITVLVWRLAAMWLPPALAVGIAMAASLLVTGAFHEDGFADACDGFGGGVTRERVLEIMKDSRIGAYGAIGIFMMLGLKWLTLAALPVASFALLVVCAHMLSRFAACALIAALPYVREGDSKARPVAEALDPSSWVASGIIGGAAIAVWLRVAQAWPGAAASQAVAAGALTAGIVTAVAAIYFRRRIGGCTGDCLGAVQQLSELAFLVAALATLRAAAG
ncbi:MAG TPA: adenosylcobinamide-GDP ribazoletransferase [Steroidobacteraceae bacterium]|nr:adenosylcobinamide-GDP ribazoletransferase [Steroidobacteraceae bacterium]